VVAGGAPLVRLDAGELELSLQSAQQDVVAQRAALDQLLNGASETLVARAAREIRERGVDWVTVTLGPEGFVGCSAAGCWHARPPDVPVVNPVGAGDALVAGLAVGLVRNFPPEELLRFAQAVAAATLTHWHAGALEPQEIAELLGGVGLRAL